MGPPGYLHVICILHDNCSVVLLALSYKVSGLVKKGRSSHSVKLTQCLVPDSQGSEVTIVNGDGFCSYQLVDRQLREASSATQGLLSLLNSINSDGDVIEAKFALG